MFRSDTVTSSSPQIKKPAAQLTAEEIETFFQVIAEQAYDPQNFCYGTLAIFRKNYLIYLHNALRNNLDNNFAIKKRLLRDQLKLLIEKQFFKNKIADTVLERIQQNLSESENTLPNAIQAEDRENFLTTIKNINETNQQLHYPKASPIPFKMQSGLTQSEKHSVAYSPVFQGGGVSFNLQHQGFEHFHKREWQAAINYFEAAIAAENELAKELKIAINSESIAYFHRFIAITYASWSQACQDTQNFASSIELSEKGIAELATISARYHTKEDDEARVRFQRTLTFSTNGLGLLYFNDKLYFSAIKQFFLAITRNSHVPNQHAEEIETINLQTFLRNIAITLDHIGIEEYFKTDFDAAIAHFQFTIVAMNKIPGSLNESDMDLLSHFYRNLALTYNMRGLKYQDQHNMDLAKENFDLAMKTIMKINPGFFSATDSEARQIYQNNFNIALAAIEAAHATQNPFRFFNDANMSKPPEKQKTLKRIRSEPEIEPRPLKRNRGCKSEPELKHSLGKQSLLR